MWIPESNLEKELEELYTIQLVAYGFIETEAREMVRMWILLSKEMGAKEGTDKLSGGFGEWLIVGARHGDAFGSKIVTQARAEGATDADIIEWWNLPDLGRRMVLWSEETFRFSVFKSSIEEGLSADDAMARVRKMFPMYGDPTDTRHVSGEDRPLPNELRGRIDDFRQRLGAARISRTLKRGAYSSYNAFIRERIREGEF